MRGKVIFCIFLSTDSGLPALFDSRTADFYRKPSSMEIAMGRFSTESFDEFLSSLKRLGIVIRNELELRERMAEARRWRFAFATLANNGRSLGIRFENHNADDTAIRNTLARFEFPEPAQSSLTAALRTQH
jgi:hypothetical protein